RKNFRMLRSLLGPAVGIMGVVKSDAYGHGILRVARVLEDEGAEYLAVAYL
ncbi:MAG: alanine racemase, partial [Deltaproteobacteria bacterium CG17_big_fil_post_rev_8_21_14_2_50_51_6]